MVFNDKLIKKLDESKLGFLVNIQQDFAETTLTCTAENLIKFMNFLKKDTQFLFDTLIDICAVDYLDFGVCDNECVARIEPRFAVVYHLLSTQLNHRCRVKVFLDEENLALPSVLNIWKAANWFEREAYDLYGILFVGHPDLRRILTDYGFIGHPFRKDFPLSGHVEMRYDATLKRVVYEPVAIEPRILTPKVIRDDNRYLGDK